MKFPKMNQAFKKKWVKALRSGEFEQGYKMLRDTDHRGKNPVYCCLGVACKIDKVPITKGHGYPPFDSAKRWGLAPKNVKEGGMVETPVIEILIEKNDRGWSFKKIATWIEKNL